MAETKTKSVFETLSAIDVSGKIEKKNGLSYVSWAWAWFFAKRAYPDAFYTIYENADGLNYHTDGRTCWVKTGVTIGGIELIEYLPVMDNRNQSIPVARVTSTDINKSIQRSLTKALARHGLGICVYAGEDLPLESDDTARDAVNAEIAKAQKAVDPALLPGGERFMAAVVMHVAGKMAGTKTARDAWAAKVKATPEQLAAFDNEVANYRINNNL